MTDNDSPWKEMLEQELPLALAQLAAMRTRKDPAKRRGGKLDLILLFQDRGMAADDLRR